MHLLSPAVYQTAPFHISKEVLLLTRLSERNGWKPSNIMRRAASNSVLYIFFNMAFGPSRSMELEHTDLVFGESLAQFADEVERTAEALVLTEWKRVQNPSKLR